MSTILDETDLEKLLTCTSHFMRHVYWVQESFDLIPDKNHYGACINYVDLMEFREDFCTELINTVSEWVYNNKKAAAILDDYIQRGRNGRNAQSALEQLARNKFRTRDGRQVHVQGQFGELLLFNFLQALFKAVPLLRKMPITTSTGMERNGADAIHYSFKGGKHLLFLGESKAYTSDATFGAAFKKAMTSILATYQKHVQELDLYIHDDFIDDR